MLDHARNQTLGSVECPGNILDGLKSGMLGESGIQKLQFSVNGVIVYPTAVLLDDGSVICLFKDMDSSIPADDTRGIPRSDEFYHGEGAWEKSERLNLEVSRKIVGVAAYRVVQSGGIVETHEARAAEVLA